MNNVQDAADAQRAEAKNMLCHAAGLSKGIMSDAIDRAVDCIIRAAVLEVCARHQEAAQKALLNRPMSDNP